MDTSWMSEPRSSTAFLKGLGEFLDVECKKNANGAGEIKCPCVKCTNNLSVTRDKATQHIICNGIMKGYNADHLQIGKEVAQVGIWGTKSKGSPHNHWSFRLENNHKLKKITIDHGDLIFSLMFTTEDDRGTFNDSKKFGGWNGGNEESEVTLDFDEEIIGINGTVGVSTGTYAGYTIISSLSFITNKTTHGPFGQTIGTPFDVPWNKGSFGGFYGLAGYYIDGIGVYLKASQETARVGLWGTEFHTGPQYRWSFCLEENFKLTKITIDHGDMISSLTFTSEDCMGSAHVSNKAGGYKDGTAVSEVSLAWDEEIIGMNGTFGVSSGTCGGKTISSLCFITNKRSHGPFGRVTRTSFSVPWSKGSFAGFYGTASYYIDSIGVYLRATA
ncbi:putative jacalin-like lectin domain, Transposase-associated domain-containing protein [Helianthus annuus]|uniref:Jacalin-like lectin domain, Transposase-associated domain-containing protein n=2 Tax=Helianthus annuus TaxID=4232 RepID=A0A9K3GY96_HELAN|nr:agglutinin [Helianthus annuus]XP_022034394.1 agglutinin [Helianthus annuus]KAF5759521.1 putative jacalin-like lectin domain, Transposase-associated domain-containing protein [Helianthus annuus]KAJ0437716.1 putative jacalin-like lectin domain, Transposase-associated domain-containing protein [Helianthus annuus]KAJ0460035.1 putative jacalin-like lectin domain, Transposase-associated domain-containing protein [Helianthus annuus]KAJ0640482.1 putative jacalin-like lectin domain, Transposase-asso